MVISNSLLATKHTTEIYVRFFTSVDDKKTVMQLCISFKGKYGTWSSHCACTEYDTAFYFAILARNSAIKQLSQLNDLPSGYRSCGDSDIHWWMKRMHMMYTG